MKQLSDIKNNKKIRIINQENDGICGTLITEKGDRMFFIFSYGGGWEHLSVSYKDRCPSWEEMCEAKKAFFKDTECCVQYHPAKENYMNSYPYCLHIWRPLKETGVIPTPPNEFV